MSCDPDCLESFVLGELSASANARVTAHARHCSACADEIQWLRREQTAMAARAQSLGTVELPPFEAVVSRASAPVVLRAPVVERSWMAGLATAALVLIGLGTSLQLRAPRRAVQQGEQVASAELPFVTDVVEDDAIASEENRYEACLWASPGPPGVDACL